MVHAVKIFFSNMCYFCRFRSDSETETLVRVEKQFPELLNQLCVHHRPPSLVRSSHRVARFLWPSCSKYCHLSVHFSVFSALLDLQDTCIWTEVCQCSSSSACMLKNIWLSTMVLNSYVVHLLTSEIQTCFWRSSALGCLQSPPDHPEDSPQSL